jgi:hypothetical protein
MADDSTRMDGGGGGINSLEALLVRLLSGISALTESDRQLRNDIQEYIKSSNRQGDSAGRRDRSVSFSGRVSKNFSDTLITEQNKLAVEIGRVVSDIAEIEGQLRNTSIQDAQRTLLERELAARRSILEQETAYQDALESVRSEYVRAEEDAARRVRSGAITRESADESLASVASELSERLAEVRDEADRRNDIENSNIAVIQSQYRSLSKTLEDTRRSFEDANDSANNFLGESLGEEAEFERERQRAIDALERQLNEWRMQLQQNQAILDQQSDLSSDERKNLEDQNELLQDQIDVVERQQANVRNAEKRDIDSKKQWSDTAKELRKIPADIANGLLKATIFDRLNGILTEGFDKVYQSVEKTRNEISARSRLDAGGYKELQDQIQDMIEQQGLEGVVNQVDVNDAITQLSAAGITDTDTLRELAFEQAKLQAYGSSLDLTNEGVITEILGLRGKGVSMDEIRSVIEAYRGQEELARKSGQTYGLERGAGTREMAETFKDMLSFGQTAELASQNIMGRLAGTTTLASIGVDPTVLSNYYSDLRDKTLSELSAEEQAFWANQGLTAESLKTIPFEEFTQKLIEGMTIYDAANKDNVKYMAQALGTNLTPTDLYKFQESDKKSLKDQLKTDKQLADAELKSFTDQAKQGAFISETEKETNKQMNMITETATTMEQFYNGDKLYHSVTDPLLGGMEQIISTIILTRSIQNPFGGTGGTGGINPSIVGGTGGVGGVGGTTGGTGGATGGGMWSGALGKGASTTVKGLGVGVGSVMAGVTLTTDILEADTWQEGLYNATEDPTFWSGIGTAAGSAIAGPLGGAVGGAIGNILGPMVKGGRGLFDKLSDAMVANSDAADAMKAIDERNAAQEEAMTASSKYLSDAAEELRSTAETLTPEEQAKLDVLDVLSKSSAFADVATSQYGAKDLLHAGNISESELPSDWFQQLLDSGLYDLEPNELDNDPKKIQEYALQYFSAKKLMNASGMEAVNAIQKYVDTHEGMTYAQAISNIYGDSIGEEQASNIVATLETMAKAKESYAKAQSKFKDKWESIVADNKGKTTEELISIYSDTYGKDLASALQYSGDTLVMENGMPKLKYAKSDGTETYNPEYYAGKFKAGMTRIPFDEYPALLHEGERILTAKEATAYNDLSSYAVESLSNSINNTDSSEIEQVFTNSIISGNEQMNDSIETQTETLSTKLDAILIAMNDLVKAIRVSSSSTGSNLSNVLKMNSNITQMNTTI